jgi:hypothetical protein
LKRLPEQLFKRLASAKLAALGVDEYDAVGRSVEDVHQSGAFPSDERQQPRLAQTGSCQRRQHLYGSFVVIRELRAIDLVAEVEITEALAAEGHGHGKQASDVRMMVGKTDEGGVFAHVRYS